MNIYAFPDKERYPRGMDNRQNPDDRGRDVDPHCCQVGFVREVNDQTDDKEDSYDTDVDGL
eukprot:CAMPEP_0184987734 /NCGR_PEP_ID=MMETSP1098-20130426/21557_1 /TAXON_ID=89044 /ORGANISM="Spumella elongata, Strain CCAP 955/1" /LENGTH=60 /DNA_ID=CAMNT_0027512323 /DNA_START=106 /DNA_END=285 /DNA_ORIENTATION=-